MRLGRASKEEYFRVFEWESLCKMLEVFDTFVMKYY